MKFEQYSFVVSSHYLSALINGDTSGLDEREERQIKRFEREYMQQGAHWCVGDDIGFDLCEVSRLYADCVELHLMVPIEA